MKALTSAKVQTKRNENRQRCKHTHSLHRHKHTHCIYDIIYKIIYVFILAVSGFYYGLNAGVTPADAESYCQSIGLRLAVLETLAEYEEAKKFLGKYKEEYGE